MKNLELCLPFPVHKIVRASHPRDHWPLNSIAQRVSSPAAGERNRALADVRRFPGSRRYPHFNQEILSESLQIAGIGYLHFAELGGRRKASPESKNTAWRNESFRAYADFMETEEFSVGIDRLTGEALLRRTVIMCSEAVWWSCHRLLIADYLKARGDVVLHILAPGKTQEHPFTSAAKIVDGELSYAAQETPRLF